jgi:Recombination endonuclease VII
MLHLIYFGCMPYKDPERAREAGRAYYQANIERVRERSRQHGETHREQKRVAAREWYWANREQAHVKSRAWRDANPEKVRENMRRWLASGGNPHRRRIETTARLWREQDGRCYLCEKPVPLEDAVLEHDHRCCPRMKFCAVCIRGASCPRCNHVIGHAEDDPDRLELIARNLRAKLAEVGEQIASKPAQLSLLDAP